MPVFKTCGKAFGRIPLILVNAFFFIPFLACCQFAFTGNCLDAYRSVLSLRFNDARASLEAEKKTDPSNLIPLYLEDYINFLTVFTGQEKAAFEKYRRDHENRIAAVKGGNPDSPLYGYCLGNMRLQWALARMQFGESRSAVLDITRAYNDYRDNEEAYPAFLPRNTGFGFIHILAGLAEDSYGWLLNLAGFRGDVGKGLQEITEVADYRGNDELTRISGTEAVFFLAMANAFLGPDKNNSAEIIRRFDDRDDPFPTASNPLVIFAKSTVYLKCGMNGEALEVLKNFVIQPGDYPFYYLDYLSGKARLNCLEPDADRYFIRFLKNFGGTNYIRSAYQKLAWTALLAGNTVKYREYMDKIRTRGSSLFDTDVQALREAESGDPPNIFLLKARLLSDGGYFDRALDILLGTRVNDMVASKKDLVEYNYRLGRIYQGKKQDDKALRYFEETIHLGKGQPWYFVGNAALQSGLICEQNKDYPDAEKYFSLCISMDFKEYKTSLNQKARAGLKRIKKHPG